MDTHTDRVNHDVHFSSGKDDWETPHDLFTALNEEFGFTLDAAANRDNHKCPMWFGPGGVAPDALTLERWGPREPLDRRVFMPMAIWLNPPYSRGLQGRFIAKAAEQSALGHLVVMLLPARTDTKAFHNHIWDREHHRPYDGVEVRFLKGRVRFKGAAHGAPFPSMVVVFRPC